MSCIDEIKGVFMTPGKGIHSYRLGGLAAFDILGTAGLAWLVARCSFGDSAAYVCLSVFVLTFIVLLAVAVCVHEALHINTRLNAAIYGREWPARRVTQSPKKTGTRRMRGGSM